MKKRLSHQIALVIMKLSLIPAMILLLAMCSFAADTRGQTVLDKKITIRVIDREISEVFASLEKITDAHFVYSPELIAASRKISVDAKKKELCKVLSELLRPLNIRYDLMNNFIVLKKDVEVKTIGGKSIVGSINDATDDFARIKGKIVSSAGLPLEGVSVVVKGSANGTTTDSKGEFAINGADNGSSVLLISYIGYIDQEIPVGKKSFISVTLIASNDQLNDLVVIGYGTQKKVSVTGAVVSVKGETLKTAPTSSITNTLVGRLPGLIATNSSGEPGYDDSRLLIRGNNTLGNNSPLVVVDGIADRAGGFSRIDVNDIESVTILKDASAAIYGSRAANGVILVTTKRGKSGKTSISYTFDYGFKKPTILPNMLDAADYATAINDVTRLIDKNPVPMYTEAEIQKFRDGSDPINYPNINPMKEALKDFSIQRRHSLTISGGSENVKYYTSVGYQYEDNIYKHSISNYKQYNLRSNIDIQANKNLRFYANLSLRQEDRNSPWQGAGELWRNIVQGDPRQLLQYPNGKLRAVTSGGYNPLTAVDGTTGYQRNKATIINADLGFNWDFSSILKGLGADGRLSIDKDNRFYKGFNQSWTLYTLNNSTGEYLPNQYGPKNASLNENMNQNVGVTSNIRLLYNRTFNTVHKINAFVAYEQYESKYDYLQGQRQNFISTAVDEVFAGDAKDALNTGTAAETGRQNYFGRVDYSYNEKYLFQFNWRYDGSEIFPKENRFGFYPGVSVGWRASEENFWKQNLSFIDYFKVRGSWGKMGNDKISRFNFLTTYTFGNNAIFGGATPVGYTGIVQVNTANPNIAWEIATTYNVGFEAKFLKNAFSFELDIFKQQRDKILTQPSASVAQYAGLSLPFVNDAKCESKGFEASLGYSKVLRDFKFNITGNLSYAKSKVINKNEAAGIPEWQKETGKPIGSNWLLYDAIGIYRTAGDLVKYPGLGNADIGDLIFRDVDGNGVLDANDRIRLEQSELPQIIYGLNIGASYKQFELSMLWQGAGKVSTYVFYEGGAGGIGNYTQDFFDNRWTPENPTASGPRIIDRERTPSAKPNTFFLKDASYLRLKNLQLSYSLPRNFLSRYSINDCRIFASAFNLLTFTGLKDIDPEATVSSQGYAGWFNVQSKVLNIGINLTF